MNDWIRPNDPLYPQQWHLHLLNMEEAWKMEKGAAQTVVAVIEEGFQLDHPDLKNQWAGHFNLSGDNDDMEHTDVAKVDHGNHVCGIIAAEANNNEGGVGVAPGCRLLPIKCGNSYDDMQLARAMHLAVSEGARVINMSNAGYHYGAKMGQHTKRGGWTIPPTDALRNACLHADRNEVLIVTSTAGNGRMQGASYPPIYPECMNVSAVNDRGQSSNFNDYSCLTEAAAPGGQRCYDNGVEHDDKAVFSCCHTKHDGYKGWTGNCQAVGCASGVAALVYSHFPGITAQHVRQIIRNTTQRVPWNPYTGHGVLDPVKSLSVLRVETAIRVEAEDIVISGHDPPTVTVTVHNDGVLDAQRVPLFLYRGKPETKRGIQLAFALVDVRGFGETAVELAPWDFTDIHELWVAIDLAGCLSAAHAEAGVYQLLACKAV